MVLFFIVTVSRKVDSNKGKMGLRIEVHLSSFGTLELWFHKRLFPSELPYESAVHTIEAGWYLECPKKTQDDTVREDRWSLRNKNENTRLRGTPTRPRWPVTRVMEGEFDSINGRDQIVRHEPTTVEIPPCHFLQRLPGNWLFPMVRSTLLYRPNNINGGCSAKAIPEWWILSGHVSYASKGRSKSR